MVRSFRARTLAPLGSLVKGRAIRVSLQLMRGGTRSHEPPQAQTAACPAQQCRDRVAFRVLCVAALTCLPAARVRPPMEFALVLSPQSVTAVLTEFRY